MTPRASSRARSSVTPSFPTLPFPYISECSGPNTPSGTGPATVRLECVAMTRRYTTVAPVSPAPTPRGPGDDPREVNDLQVPRECEHHHPVAQEVLVLPCVDSEFVDEDLACVLPEPGSGPTGRERGAVDLRGERGKACSGQRGVRRRLPEVPCLQVLARRDLRDGEDRRDHELALDGSVHQLCLGPVGEESPDHLLDLREELRVDLPLAGHALHLAPVDCSDLFRAAALFVDPLHQVVGEVTGRATHCHGERDVRHRSPPIFGREGQGHAAVRQRVDVADQRRETRESASITDC